MSTRDQCSSTWEGDMSTDEPSIQPNPEDLLTPSEPLSSSAEEDAAPPNTPPPPKSFEYYVSGSVRKLHERSYGQVVSLLLDKGLFFNSQRERYKPPYRFLSPETLKRRMDFKLRREPLINPQSPRATAKELIKMIRFLIDYSPHPSHPFMVSKNSAGLDPYGILGDLLSTAMSQSVVSYFLSPVYTLMEFEVYQELRKLFNYPVDEGAGGGTVVSSHGLANAFAIQMAIQEKFPGVKDKGLYAVGNPKVAIFVSDQADYSFEKYSIWEGLGSSSCIRVKTDKSGRMDVKELERKIQKYSAKNWIPTMIVATAGTNVLGAIDPSDSIAAIAAKYKMWFHVNGHLAGSCVFSQEHKKRLAGIEKSDSVVWSADKMLAAPSTMTIILSREPGKLKAAFDLKNSALFLPEPFYDHGKWDTRFSTAQATRRPDILKMWLMWKVKGRKGLGDQVDGTYALTKLCVEELQARSSKFALILPKFDSNLVSFYYVPRSLRKHFKFPLEDYADLEELTDAMAENQITETIKNRLLKRGKMQISLGVLPGKELPKFFVMSLNNTVLTIEDIRYMLDLIEYFGDQVRISYTKDYSSGVDNSPDRAQDGSDAAEGEEDTKAATKVPRVPPPPQRYPDYVSAPIESMHRPMFEGFFKTIFELGIYFQDRRSESPYRYLQPEELLKEFPISLADKDTASQDGSYMPVEEINKIIKAIIFYNANRGHPYFVYHPFQAIDPYTIIADFVATCLTSTMYTFEDGPVYTMMEKELEDALRRRVMYKEAAAQSLPGGSIGNQLTIALAFYKKFPEVKKYGIHGVGKQGVIFFSTAAHYCTIKGSFLQGIGINNCVSVKTDPHDRMDPEDLRQKVKRAKLEGKVPFMVCATMGTSVLGSFDPLDEISKICEKYGMWLHADGAYGGSAIMSNDQIFRFGAIERSDSFIFNAHKMLASAFHSTAWITRHKGILKDFAPTPSSQQFRLNPDLYDQELYDTGETHAVTDRRPDVIKLWLIWKMKGNEGLEKHVNRSYELTSYAHKQLLERSSKNKRFQITYGYPQDAPNINFLYVPPELQDSPEPERKNKLKCVQTALQFEMLKKRNVAISTKTVAAAPDHLVFGLYNTCLTEADIDYVFQLVQYYGERLNLKSTLESCATSAL